MTPSEPCRVFISYARKDGADLAQRLQSDLGNQGFDVWLDTQRLGGGAVWSMEIEREIDTRQVALALLSPGSYVSEICRAEQLRALDKGNRLIPVLAVKGSDRPFYLYARQYRDFTDKRNYEVSLGELIEDIRGDVTATLPTAYRKTTVKYLTAPPQVTNYLERPEALRALRDTLFAEDQRQPIALTALAGMGGIGKTVLAKAITDDEVVQRAFPDGIVWITAGKERKRDFAEEMRQIAEVLGEDTNTGKKITDWQDEYRIRIANKAALLVVDDVWSKTDIEPLLVESPRSRFLFTTRNAAIGRFVSAREHRAGLLDVAQSRELLASWANVPAAELPAIADQIILECGRLPLALAVVGGMLRGASAELWNDTLRLLRNADLSTIEDQLPEGQDSFFKAVEVSYQSLKPAIKERYKELAVLLEDVAVPVGILQTLWGLSDAEARWVSRQFIDRSLALRSGESGDIQLHDLQLDYVRSLYPDRRALDLIHGAWRLSFHVIERNPKQFASQIVGRLLPCEEVLGIRQFAESVIKGAPRPWLRPLYPALHPPGTELVRTLIGHSARVYSVALSKDGRCALSNSEDEDEGVKVWDLESGRELRTLATTGFVTALAVSRDGTRAVSVSGEDKLKLWDLQTGGEVRTLAGHSDIAEGVTLTDDGRQAVTACRDNTLKVWDLESGRELHNLEGHTDVVSGVAVSADGRHGVSASWDNTLRVWDLKSGHELRILEGHSDAVNDVAVSADGRRAVSASSDQTLKVWDLERGQELRTLQGHSDRVHSVAMDADGRRAVSASWDQTLKVWDLKTDREPHIPAAHSGSINGVAASKDGNRAISAAADGTLKLWDMETGRELRTLSGHSGAVNDVAMIGDGWRAVSASSDHTLKVWDLETGRDLLTLAGHSLSVEAVAVSRDGQRAVSASYDGTLKVWDLQTGRDLRTLVGHSGWVFAVALSEAGHRAVSAHDYRTLKVWDLDRGLELHALAGHSSWSNGISISGNGRRAVSASRDHTLKEWDLDTGREVRTLAGHAWWVNDVAISPSNERLVVSASRDYTVRVWNLENGTVLATLTCDSPMQCCAFAGGRKIVAGDLAGRLHFLSLELESDR